MVIPWPCLRAVIAIARNVEVSITVWWLLTWQACQVEPKPTLL